ncbi:intraflagellar transport-associated protein isoform X1 [Lepus europaeus]|uniref:intraflagellar transport-associated protein isoform X1 n=1 Tax=Lepus europaeus TaxID=9983 RepID=UPI002B46B82A|nr:intraflagellar transport-associated protein isoform X1 [Lepus europaeus]XP_062054015.1 intraflagellar transport-associated protein isoform X1 [Lepus europaeus]
MPAQISDLKIMDEDRVIEEALDKFVNSHEQTYEEFLSTFTYLSKEDNGMTRGAFGTSSSEKLPSVKCTHENEPNDHHHLGSKIIFLRTSSQCLEEQIVAEEGQKVGIFLQGDLNRAGKVKEDPLLDLEDLDVDEEIKPRMSKGALAGAGLEVEQPGLELVPIWNAGNTDLLLLPGEVEQDIQASVPPMDQPLTPHVKPKPTVKGTVVEEIPRAEVQSSLLDEGDEVQTFCLDEEFDYDSVTLTPKFTPAEIESIKELSKQRTENTNVNLEEASD